MGRAKQAPEAEHDEQRTDRHADNPSGRGDGAPGIAKEKEPQDAYHRTDREVPERQRTGVGKGPPGTQEQDGEEEQGWRDRTTDGQHEEPGEKVAHERCVLRMVPKARLPRVWGLSAKGDFPSCAKGRTTDGPPHRHVALNLLARRPRGVSAPAPLASSWR